MNYFLNTCILLLLAGTAFAQGTVEVQIPNVGSNKGKVIIMLFNNPEGFPIDREKAYKKVVLSATEGAMSHKFEGLQPGTYAVSITQDENDNGETDRNFIGMPKEPVGASNQASMGKPSFKRSKFDLPDGNQQISIEVAFFN